MPVKKKIKRTREVHVLVGTHKGGFRFRSDLRRRSWKLDGPFFAGAEVNHLTRDPRKGHLWAATHTAWWGSDLQVSRNGGKTWRKSCEGPSFASDRGLTLNRIWQVVPDRPSRPETMWCGVDPGALFRSDNGGRNWYEVEGLNRHRTRDRWQPGGGGLMVHGIFPDPARENRIYVALSAAGCFRSDDDGRTWLPRNKDVLADFMPKPFPEVGQCVHHMVMNPRNPDQLFQQNHCGVYRSRNGGADWEDISEGLPSRFGFPMAAHPHEPETLFVVPEVGPEARYVCDGRLTVYRTKNGGKAWRKLTRGLPQKNAYIQVLRHAMQTDTCDNPAVYFGTTSGELYYSLNNGDSWQLLQTHLPRIYSVEAVVV